MLAALDRHAQLQPAACALQGVASVLRYDELKLAVDGLATRLDAPCIGLLMDNGLPWAVADLAALRAGVTCVPLPGFFSAGQLQHALADAGVALLLTDQPERVQALCGPAPEGSVEIVGERLALFRLAATSRNATIPNPMDSGALVGVAKLTYTSGTTGTPKGVRLGAAAIDRVAVSLLAATGANAADRSLAMLPLSTLLENIALYVALLGGGICVLPPLQSLGMRGATGLQPAELVRGLQRYRPTCLVLIPQLLQALVETAEAGVEIPDSLRFIAVGGAPVSRRLLERAQALGLPVFEGYGLSEAASVVTLNTPQAQQLGSVGRPLAHARVRIAADGEICVSGALCRGYLGDPDFAADAYWPTGDLGYRDAAGFLYLTGRKKNIFITAFGRNVAPEWVERELLTETAIAQAVLFGEARPFNVAIVVPRPGATTEAVQAAIDATNQRLPDYARIRRFLFAEEAFSVENGLLTGTARPRRAMIAKRYAASIQSCYEEVA